MMSIHSAAVPGQRLYHVSATLHASVSATRLTVLTAAAEHVMMCAAMYTVLQCVTCY